MCIRDSHTTPIELPAGKFLLCLFGKLFDTGLYPADLRIVVGKPVSYTHLSCFLSSGRVVIMAYSSVFCGKRSTNGMVVFPKNSSPSPELVWVT